MAKPLSDNLARVYGNYRAKVVDNKDTEFFGRILIWIPDLMVDIPEDKGIWARPANNPIGGRNSIDDDENWFMGSCYVPRKGSWVWIFFEAGNINKPYYFAGLDIEASVVLPENRLGKNPEDKWTVFKSNRGRTIVISDDPSDERVEITGKKLAMTNVDTMEPPSGDTASVYVIDKNQTTILLDEREGKQKVLIRTVKGDFLHIDIDEQKLQAYFASDIVIRTGGNLLMTAQANIDIKSLAGDIKVSADAGFMDVSANADYREYAGGNKNSKAMNSQYIQAQNDISELAGQNINTDAGKTRSDQCSLAEPAERAISAAEAIPAGKRDT